MSDDEITEFASLDPDEMHLVPRGANNFPFLLAKGIDQAISDVQDESPRSHQPKGNTMKTSGHPALEELEDRVAKAEESGTADAIRTARRQLTAAKMVAAENARCAWREVLLQVRSRLRRAVQEHGEHRRRCRPPRDLMITAWRRWRALRWRLRYENPRGLTRAEYLAAEEVKRQALAAAEFVPTVTWPHERRGRRPYLPPPPTPDQIAAILNRQRIQEANRRG